MVGYISILDCHLAVVRGYGINIYKIKILLRLLQRGPFSSSLPYIDCHLAVQVQVCVYSSAWLYRPVLSPWTSVWGKTSVLALANASPIVEGHVLVTYIVFTNRNTLLCQ